MLSKYNIEVSTAGNIFVLSAIVYVARTADIGWF